MKVYTLLAITADYAEHYVGTFSSVEAAKDFDRSAYEDPRFDEYHIKETMADNPYVGTVVSQRGLIFNKLFAEWMDD